MNLGDDFIAPYYKPENVNIPVMRGETGPLWKISDLDYTVSASTDKRLVRSPEDRIGRIADRTPGAYILPEADPHESRVKRLSPKENNICPKS